MSATQPSFYGRTGTRWGDFVTLLHIPYTAWNLSYLVIGASLAPQIDLTNLAGALLAFFFGLGIGAHALDEVQDRPLGTGFSDQTLNVLGWGGLAVAGGFAIAGAIVVSPTVLIWGIVGILLAAAYALELGPWIHTDLGFALAWGAFPVLVGYWSQTQSVSAAAIAVALGATLLSLAQRSLSTPARHIRRRTAHARAVIGEETLDEEELLQTWERPLRLLALAHVVLAIGLLAS